MEKNGTNSRPPELSTRRLGGSLDIVMTTEQSYSVMNGQFAIENIMSLHVCCVRGLVINLLVLASPSSFAYTSSIKQLPQWVRPYVQTYNKFGLVQRDLRVFFKEANKDVRKS